MPNQKLTSRINALMRAVEDTARQAATRGADHEVLQALARAGLELDYALQVLRQKR